MRSIFEFKSYKKYLREYANYQGRGAIANFAKAAGCDRTYLSQCLSSKVQLTPDHVLGISEYLQLSTSEEEFLLLLLLNERSVSKNAQSRIKAKMDMIIQTELILSKKIGSKNDSDELTDEEKAKYYSGWKYVAVHTLTSIKEFQTTRAIAEKLNLSELEVLAILKELSATGLVFFNSEKWKHSGKNIHIPVGSTYNSQNHINWRLRAFDSFNDKNAVHYTTVFSLSKSDWSSLREQLLEFIGKQRDFIHSSGTEEMFSFCCDLYQISE